MIWLILVFLAAFLVTLYLTPVFIVKLRAAGIVGTDIHKAGKPLVPEMGGLAVLFGFASGIFLSIPFFSKGLVFLYAAFLTVLIAGLIGVCDDVFGIRQKRKAWLPVFASVPLVVTQAGVSSMIIPFFGEVDFGILYPFIIIPLAITIASNSTNMLAGYNGLETGLGFIASVFVGIGSLLVNRLEVSILMFSLAGSLLAFLKFNKYPSQIFIGDVGTFVIGSAIAAAVIIGNMEVVGMIAMGAFMLNGIITVFDILRKKPIKKFSDIKNGKLVPPSRKYVYTLYFFIESRYKLAESKLVHILWVIGLFFGIMAVIFLVTQFYL